MKQIGYRLGLKPQEAAEYLGVSVSAFRQLYLGENPAIRTVKLADGHNGTRLVPVGALLEYLGEPENRICDVIADVICRGQADSKPIGGSENDESASTTQERQLAI
jgi:hypothetical protein